MDTVHRERRRLSAALTLTFLLAAVSPPVAPTAIVHVTSTHRSTHIAVSVVRSTSLTPGPMNALASVDTGEPPDERDREHQAPVPARVERVTTSRDARRPAPSLVSGNFQHLRI